jgi:hypothetical protein
MLDQKTKSAFKNSFDTDGVYFPIDLLSTDEVAFIEIPY